MTTAPTASGNHYTYAYDNEGNETDVYLKNASGGTLTHVAYTWDYRNRLVAEQTYSVSGTVSTLTSEAKYAYNAADQRVTKAVDADGNGSYETLESYFYDGTNLVLVTTTADAVVDRYLMGQQQNQVLAQESVGTGGGGSNVTLWAFTDHEQTVRATISYDGSGYNQTTYSVFGQIVGSYDQMRMGYTGQVFDAETGLNYDNHRYYDSSVGRFISVDPMGFAAGDGNLYRYVGNGPFGASDPTGEKITLDEKSFHVTVYAGDADVDVIRHRKDGTTFIDPYEWGGDFYRDMGAPTAVRQFVPNEQRTFWNWNPIKWMHTGSGFASGDRMDMAETGGGEAYTQNAGTFHRAMQSVGAIEGAGWLATATDTVITVLEGSDLHERVMQNTGMEPQNDAQRVMNFIGNATPKVARNLQIIERAEGILNDIESAITDPMGFARTIVLRLAKAQAHKAIDKWLDEVFGDGSCPTTAAGPAGAGGNVVRDIMGMLPPPWQQAGKAAAKAATREIMDPLADETIDRGGQALDEAEMRRQQWDQDNEEGASDKDMKEMWPDGKTPTHHIMTVENDISTAAGGPYTPKFEELAEKRNADGGLPLLLEDTGNKLDLPGHFGPHPEYNREVYQRMFGATQGKSGEDYNTAYDKALKELKEETDTPGTRLYDLATGKKGNG